MQRESRSSPRARAIAAFLLYRTVQRTLAGVFHQNQAYTDSASLKPSGINAGIE